MRMVFEIKNTATNTNNTAAPRPQVRIPLVIFKILSDAKPP